MKKLFISPKQRIAEFAAYVILVIAGIIALIGFLNAGGEAFPTHFDLAGNIDGYGSAATLFLIPGMMLFVSLMMSLMIRFAPISMMNLPFRVKPEREFLVYGDLVWLFIGMIIIFNVYALVQTILWAYQISSMIPAIVLVIALFADIIAGMVIAIKHNG